MGNDTTYTFFDAAIMDPLWRRIWKDVTPYLVDEMELLFDSENPDEQGSATEAELSEIYQKRTLAWTIRRSNPQFQLMHELMQTLPKMRGKLVDVVGDHNTTLGSDALVAAGIHAWAQERLPKLALKAVLKLHNVEFDTLTTEKTLTKPLYSWQGPEACQGGYFSSDNCIGPKDTLRFLDFLALAWKENWAVPDVDDACDASSSGNPGFREFKFVQDLVRVLKKIRRFERPTSFRTIE